MPQHGKYPDCFYRVIVKAVIRDERGYILMVKEDSDEWDLPGGGVSHGETLDEALVRELREEIGYQGSLAATLIGTQSIYSKRADMCPLFLIYNVTLNDTYAPMTTSDTTAVAFINPTELTQNLTSRSNQLVKKFVLDSSYHISFLPTP